ncbi:MAG: hypothetical protein CM1200mP29_09560 [Verrucomicrobiota bacterium]|nr:MAG: hypothetical protein CM1200mP29_09560 [Verrucomicrobiota bacterium]
MAVKHKGEVAVVLECHTAPPLRRVRLFRPRCAAFDRQIIRYSVQFH